MVAGNVVTCSSNYLLPDFNCAQVNISNNNHKHKEWDKEWNEIPKFYHLQSQLIQVCAYKSLKVPCTLNYIVSIMMKVTIIFICLFSKQYKSTQGNFCFRPPLWNIRWTLTDDVASSVTMDVPKWGFKEDYASTHIIWGTSKRFSNSICSLRIFINSSY